jgi:aspartyl-tRNA(Asn)/glutamyl-tRNA(Gln) amidotransferase subunit A
MPLSMSVQTAAPEPAGLSAATVELATLSATQATALFAAGKLSPVETTRAVIDTIGALNPLINAFCWLDTDAALKTAAASEARWRRGAPLSALDGITATVKDLSVTRGWPTRRACLAIPADRPWEEDSPSVARMREAGAVLLGKTTVPEFGASYVTQSKLCGITRNPWNPANTPGGSSGGAAASAIAGMGTIALASDAAGSIRGPAAMTGTFGLKTTFGRVPDYPSSYLGSLAVIGPITRSVEDAWLCMEVITRPDARDSYALTPPAPEAVPGEPSLKGLRVLYSPTLGYAQVEPESAAIVRAAVARLAALGAEIDEVDHVMSDPSDTLWTIMAAGVANAFRVFGFTEADMALIGPRLVASAERGRAMSMMEYMAACEKREQLGARLRALHETYDLLVMPCLAVPAIGAEGEEHVDPRYAAIANRAPFNAPFNLTKQPAASLPVGMTADGMPVGMQVVGPLDGDRAVMRACLAYQRAYPFAAPDLLALSRQVPADHVPQGIQSMLDAITRRS